MTYHPLSGAVAQHLVDVGICRRPSPGGTLPVVFADPDGVISPEDLNKEGIPCNAAVSVVSTGGYATPPRGGFLATLTLDLQVRAIRPADALALDIELGRLFDDSWGQADLGGLRVEQYRRTRPLSRIFTRDDATQGSFWTSSWIFLIRKENMVTA